MVTTGIDNFDPNFSSNGDIFIRSVDGIGFNLESAVLKAHSTVFRDMFQFPGDPNEAAEEPVTVALTEKSIVLAFLFNCIYPTAVDPALNDFESAWDVADAAEKYDMPGVKKMLRLVILSTDKLREDSVNLYAIASMCNWRDLLPMASKYSLKSDISVGKNIPVLRRAQTSDMFALLELHWKRKDAFKSAIWTPAREMVERRGDSFICLYCGSSFMGVNEQDIEEFSTAVESYIDRFPLASDTQYESFWEKHAAKFSSLTCEEYSSCGAPFLDCSYPVEHLRNLRIHNKIPGSVDENGEVRPETF